MKKTLLITLFALLGITHAAAQDYEYVPFVREGVKWVYGVTNSEFAPNPALPVGVFYYNLEFKS